MDVQFAILAATNAILAEAEKDYAKAKPIEDELELNKLSSGYSPGFWPADKGAREWGKRNGVSSSEVGNRLHEIKDGVGGRANQDFGVNPATGEVEDSNGESAGNLNDF